MMVKRSSVWIAILTMQYFILTAIFLSLFACNSTTDYEQLSSCRTIELTKFEHPQLAMDLRIPVNWETEIDVNFGDTLGATSIDTAYFNLADLDLQSRSSDHLHFNESLIFAFGLNPILIVNRIPLPLSNGYRGSIVNYVNYTRLIAARIKMTPALFDNLSNPLNMTQKSFYSRA